MLLMNQILRPEYSLIGSGTCEYKYEPNDIRNTVDSKTGLDSTLNVSHGLREKYYLYVSFFLLKPWLSIHNLPGICNKSN